jgi:hypothetical protein
MYRRASLADALVIAQNSAMAWSSRIRADDCERVSARGRRGAAGRRKR